MFRVFYLALLLMNIAATQEAGASSSKEVVVDRVGTDSREPIGVQIALKEPQSGLGLTILVDPLVGHSIVQSLEHAPTLRPLTFDLFANIILKLKATVTRVEIAKVESGTYFASVILQSSEGQLEIDARPSDAIALAITAQVPIAIEQALLKSLPPSPAFVEMWPHPAVNISPPSRPPPPGGFPVPTFLDLAYADASPLQKLDLYLPQKSDTATPLVIWIHGGGWLVGDKRSMPNRNFGPAPKPQGPMGPYQIQVPDVATLLEKGYAVVSLNYRLNGGKPEGVKSAMQDAKAAVRFLRAKADKYHLDPNKFAVWGNSAGGYMAAMLGATGDQATVFDEPAFGDIRISSAVQAVIVWYGAAHRPEGSALAFSDYLPSAKKLPPYLIANGDADPIISATQARRLHDMLIKAGAKSILTLVPGAGHEDPLFMSTQMEPAFSFIDLAFGR